MAGVESAVTTSRPRSRGVLKLCEGRHVVIKAMHNAASTRARDDRSHQALSERTTKED